MNWLVISLGGSRGMSINGRRVVEATDTYSAVDAYRRWRTSYSKSRVTRVEKPEKFIVFPMDSASVINYTPPPPTPPSGYQSREANVRDLQ